MPQTEPTYVIKLEDITSDNPDVGSKALNISELMKIRILSTARFRPYKAVL